jgi:hypothetical protein
MNRRIIFFSASLPALLFIVNTARGQAPVVYVASTPCSTGTRPLPGIPPGKTGCELIKWVLKLSGDGTGTYILDCDYGMPKQGTRGFINGGTRLHREGKWVIVKETHTNPSAVIYCLDPDKPAESISFIRLNDNLLHLLDSSGQLMTGTGAWSYTLSRVGP